VVVIKCASVRVLVARGAAQQPLLCVCNPRITTLDCRLLAS
jgi:hypothetical protein